MKYFSSWLSDKSITTTSSVTFCLRFLQSVEDIRGSGNSADSNSRRESGATPPVLSHSFHWTIFEERILSSINVSCRPASTYWDKSSFNDFVSYSNWIPPCKWNIVSRSKGNISDEYFFKQRNGGSSRSVRTSSPRYWFERAWRSSSTYRQWPRAVDSYWEFSSSVVSKQQEPWRGNRPIQADRYIVELRFSMEMLREDISRVLEAMISNVGIADCSVYRTRSSRVWVMRWRATLLFFHGFDLRLNGIVAIEHQTVLPLRDPLEMNGQDHR